jgi:hypothetical protein
MMNKCNPEQWQALFGAQQASGLSQKQFCKEHKLCAKYFSLRRRQLADIEELSKTPSPLIKVQRSTPLPTLTVSLHYQNIEVHFH